MNDVIDTPDDALILIVDDLAQNIQLLGKVLDNHGYRVVAVSRGEQVLKTARKYDPDLILLDIMMPDKSGYEVCRELKADSQIKEIPVIFLTARSDDEDIIKGLKLGGADYVTKPFNSGELIARVETHLNLKQARDKILKQQDRLEQLMDTREKLNAIIAHDLKGVLFGISGLSEIVAEEIAEQPVDEEIKQNIALISESTTSANLILINLLGWANLQTGNMDLQKDKCSIYDIVKESIRLHRVLAESKQLELRMEPADKKKSDQEGALLADRQMIATVVRNLISNAIKYSNPGDRVTIRFSTIGDGAKLSVSDEGIGMPPDVQKHIFDPDHRPKRRGTGKEVGVGLGLLLCKDFIEAHDGEISVESEPRKGTTFHIFLPDSRQTG